MPFRSHSLVEFGVFFGILSNSLRDMFKLVIVMFYLLSLLLLFCESLQDGNHIPRDIGEHDAHLTALGAVFITTSTPSLPLYVFSFTPSSRKSFIEINDHRNESSTLLPGNNTT